MTTTMTDTIKITEKVRNYQGNNSFINKMKESLNQWGRLTPKQMEAAEKCLNSQPTKVTVDERPELKRIVEYTGESKFVKDIAEKFQKWGTLTDKQVTAALAQIDKEEYKEKVLKLRIPTPGETILIGRKIGQQLKETYGLEFNPTLIDITKLLGMSPKAVKFQGKMTVKRSKVCMCCAKTLTDEFSMLTGMGKICSKHMRVPYITDRSQADQYREDYLKRVEEIGLMEFWIPKSQIKKWEGDRSIMLEMLS
jgi:hypothetical protein